MKKRLIVLMLVGLFVVPAMAVMNPSNMPYVDAEGGVGGNTVRASDGDPDLWWTTATSPDGLWGRRTFGNNPSGLFGKVAGSNDIFEASGTGSGVEDCMPIVTTISGLTPGETYSFTVVYWSPASQNWNIRAGFGLDSLVYFDRAGLEGAVAGVLTGRQEDDRLEILGWLGASMADMNGQVKVYIDDRPATGYANRTWYDGIIVTPEPATMMLLGLGSLVLLRKKR